MAAHFRLPNKANASAIKRTVRIPLPAPIIHALS
jgi:hypothetical protein